MEELTYSGPAFRLEPVEPKSKPGSSEAKQSERQQHYALRLGKGLQDLLKSIPKPVKVLSIELEPQQQKAQPPSQEQQAQQPEPDIPPVDLGYLRRKAKRARRRKAGLPQRPG